MEEQTENNAAAAGEKSSSTSHFYYYVLGGLALVLVLGGAAAGGAASAAESRSSTDNSNNPVGLPTVPAPSMAPAGLSPVPTLFPTVIAPAPGPTTLMPTVFQPQAAFRPCDAPSDCASQTCAWRYDGSVAPSTTQVCCPDNDGSGATTTLSDGRSYCTGVPGGGRCVPDTAMCAGRGSTCDGDTQVCRTTVTVGELCFGLDFFCTFTEQCARRFLSADEMNPPAVCCAEVGTIRYELRDWCAGYVSGTPCAVNAMCASGICVNQVCVAEEQGLGQACDEGVDCVSGFCSSGNQGGVCQV